MFILHLKTYQDSYVLCGLSNAPTTFQSALDIFLSKIWDETCLIYFDDAVIFSKNERQHVMEIYRVATLHCKVHKRKHSLSAAFEKTWLQPAPLSSRHTVHNGDNTWVHVSWTENLSNMFQKSLKHAMIVYAKNQNWISRTIQLRL